MSICLIWIWSRVNSNLISSTDVEGKNRMCIVYGDSAIVGSRKNRRPNIRLTITVTMHKKAKRGKAHFNNV